MAYLRNVTTGVLEYMEEGSPLWHKRLKERVPGGRFPQWEQTRGPITEGDQLTVLADEADVVQEGGTNFAVPAGAWNTVGDVPAGTPGGVQNATGFTIDLCIRAGVTGNPQQNGHIYLEIAPDNNNGALPTTGWLTCDVTGFRNNQAAGTGGGTVQAGGPNLGSLVGLKARVPKGWWYRLRTLTIAGYAKPGYILDGAQAGFFRTVT